jgi:predicted Zn-dependent peptidase
MSCVAVSPGGAQGAPAAGIEVRQLSNGLTVIVEARPDALVTGVSLVVRAGDRDDPPELPGVVATLAAALVYGSESRPTPSSVTAEIDEVAGDVELIVDADLVHYRVQVPDGELRSVLAMLSYAMLNPRFSIAGTGEALSDALLGEFAILPSDFAADLWPDHPAGRSFDDLDDAAQERARYGPTLRDLMLLRERYFVARNMALAIVGPVDAASALTQAAQYFSPLPAGEYRPIAVQQSGPPHAGRTTVPSLSTQSAIVMAFPTVGLLSPDEPAVAMLSLALSGPAGRLFQDVRVEHGLAYLVDGGSVTLADVGALVAVAEVDPENTEAALERMAAVFAELRERPPDGAELAQLRQRLRGAFLIGRESATRAADDLGTNAMLGLPIDPAEQLARYEVVTADDLRRVASQYIRPERAVIQVTRPLLVPEPEVPTVAGEAATAAETHR